jgi:hypothetical protein
VILSLKFSAVSLDISYLTKRPSFERESTELGTLAISTAQEQKAFIRLLNDEWEKDKHILMMLLIIYQAIFIFTIESFEKSLNMISKKRELIFKTLFIANFTVELATTLLIKSKTIAVSII